MSAPATSEPPSNAKGGEEEPPVPEHPDVNVDVDVEARSDGSDRFSDYESIASSTASVSSSVFTYEYENGRRYSSYKQGAYYLPNDDTEQDRLDLTHHLFRLSLDGDLTMTKLENPQRILDVGSKSWVIELCIVQCIII